MYTRTELLVGKEGVEKLRNSSVAVMGVGGVGAYAAEMIARAGVGEMVIVDDDCVNVTNINRQLLATGSTVGRKKVEVMAERLSDINPSLKIRSCQVYIDEDNVAGLMESIGHVDFLIDAIDTLSPKLALIEYCYKNGISFVSSMGAGAKFDVTRIRIADISKSKGFKVVFSEELPLESAIVPCDERNKKSQVGTISYMPAVFGCAAAQAALLHILGKC